MAVISLFSSCREDDDSNKLLKISGNVGDVVVVATTGQWEGETGKVVRTYLEQSIYGMPQEEPLFSLIRTNQKDFERLFKTFRNVLIVEIDTNRFSTGNVTYHKNVWAKGQLVITVSAGSRNEWITVFEKNVQQITYALQSKELNRLTAQFKSSPNELIANQLRDSLHLNMVVPKFAYMATCDSTHAWVRMEREKRQGGYQHEISQGIIIYKYRYTAKQQFLDENLFATRDSILKAFIPGPSEGSYMTTEYRFQPPITKEIDFDGHFAKEIHGLWRVENDFMGGPMVSYFVLNEEEGMIYSISGYVFAPQFDKREYYREVEAISKSTRLLEPAN